MKWFIAILGSILLFGTLWEAFESIILPRRVTRPFRFARLFYRVTWKIWSSIARRMHRAKLRETYLSYYGPLSLLGLFATWMLTLIVGFAMLQFAGGSSMNVLRGVPSFKIDLYMSGTTFFTLGLGDVTPSTTLARAITVAEAGTGFGFLAIVISYLPTLYGAFSQRELNISLLDARAGSPPTAAELLRRHAHMAGMDMLSQYLRDWEIWSAQLMETHLSYPVLCYFRSQHDNQSWLAAFTSILDLSALLIAYGEGTAKFQAQLTLAIARHAVADVSEVLRVQPIALEENRLRAEDVPHVRKLLLECGAPNCAEAGDMKLKELRSLYEPYLYGLSRRLLMPLPSWGVEANSAASLHSVWGRITSEPSGQMSRSASESGHF